MLAHGLPMEEPILNSIFWNHLVYPELASDEVEGPTSVLAWLHDRLPSGRWPEYVVCIAVNHLDIVEPDDRRMLVQRIRAAIADALLPGQCNLLGFAHTNALYFCGNPQEERNAFLDRLTRLNDHIVNVMALSSTIGVAFLKVSDLNGLQWAAQRAIVAQRQKVRSGPHRVYVFDESTLPTYLDLGPFWKLAQRMHAVIRKGDAASTNIVLDEIIHALFRDTYLSLNQLRPILQSQVIFMAQAATDIVGDADSVARYSEDFLRQIGTAYDYARMQELLTKAALCFTRLVDERFRSVTHRLAAAVDEYVDAHYRDPELSLQQIAAAIGASPAHVSRTYKKVKGVGVTRTISRYRVEYARRLLRNHEVSITDVAFESGFGSIQHFGRVFRELTGQTPTAFRRPNSSPAHPNA